MTRTRMAAIAAAVLLAAGALAIIPNWKVQPQCPPPTQVYTVPNGYQLVLPGWTVDPPTTAEQRAEQTVQDKDEADFYANLVKNPLGLVAARLASVDLFGTDENPTDGDITEEVPGIDEGYGGIRKETILPNSKLQLMEKQFFGKEAPDHGWWELKAEEVLRAYLSDPGRLEALRWPLYRIARNRDFTPKVRSVIFAGKRLFIAPFGTKAVGPDEVYWYKFLARRAKEGGPALARKWQSVLLEVVGILEERVRISGHGPLKKIR